MINCGGAANTWAFARSLTTRKPAIAIVQELCMTPAKQADLARFLSKNSFRCFFSVPPPVRNVKGELFASGGVAIFVRNDKQCHQVQKFASPDGQAIMIQLDHTFVIGAYIPPRPDELEMIGCNPPVLQRRCSFWGT